jgi:preprotein translocase subunit SecG
MGNIWMNLVLALQLLSAIAIIGLVLIQHGKGADMGASFGGGSSGSLFGATGSANFLSRSTAVAATFFFLATLGMAYFSTTGMSRSTPGGTSVLERAAASSTAASGAAPGIAASAPIPAVLPGAIPSGSTVSAPAASASPQPAVSASAPAAIPK